MEDARMKTPVEDGLLWHRPQVQRLVVAKATSHFQVLKIGSTEDFFTHAPDWPSGVPIV